MLQYLYNETGAAAQEIVEKVAPEVNAVSKGEIMEAATERAEEIAADVAKADETITQDQHSAIVDACSQVIYAQVCSDLARIQASDNIESLFSEEIVEDYYSTVGKATVTGAIGGALGGAVEGSLIGWGAHALTGKKKLHERLASQGLKKGTAKYEAAYEAERRKRRNKFIKRGAIIDGTAGAVLGGVRGHIAGKAMEAFK